MPNICIGNYELLKKGDLVVADASEDYEGVANPCVVNFDLQDKVVAGLRYNSSTTYKCRLVIFIL